MIPKIKQHRLAQLGIIKLTARQKNRVAKLCKCSKTHIESVLSDQHDTINYKIFYFAAVETENKAYIKKYHRPIYEQKQK
jgi:hypothetical protein